MAQPLIVISSVVLLVAVAWTAYTLLSLITRPRVIDPELGRFEEARRQSLRAASTTYRLFEPWVDELAPGIRARRASLVDKVRQDLLTSAEPVPWKAEELMAVWRVQAIFAVAGAVAFGLLFMSWVGAVMLLVFAFWGYERYVLRKASRRAAIRRQAIKRRFASGIDLLSLMMEVGGNFQESLAAIARESQDSPLGFELNRVLQDIEGGRPRKEALRTFADRLADDDAAELVFAVVQGEELGTPLTTILRNQADQIRQKRSQWAEKASQEAQVAMVFPAMVIMVACLIIVAAPFILGSAA